MIFAIAVQAKSDRARTPRDCIFGLALMVGDKLLWQMTHYLKAQSEELITTFDRGGRLVS